MTMGVVVRKVAKMAESPAKNEIRLGIYKVRLESMLSALRRSLGSAISHSVCRLGCGAKANMSCHWVNILFS